MSMVDALKAFNYNLKISLIIDYLVSRCTGVHIVRATMYMYMYMYVHMYMYMFILSIQCTCTIITKGH